MEIEKIQVLNRSNVWNTNAKKLIQITLNIGDLESKLTNTINGFSDRLKTLIPSLYTHKSSEESFFKSVDKGISIVKVIQHIAVELQSLAGTQTEFSRIEQTDKIGIYNLEFSYIDEDATVYAALASVEIVEALIKGKPYFIRHDIDRLKCLFEQYQSTKESKKTADNIPYFKLSNETVQLSRVV